MMEKELSSTKAQILALMQHLTSISPFTQQAATSNSTGNPSSSSSSNENAGCHSPAAASSKEVFSSKSSWVQFGMSQQEGATYR
jgi:hypothetical protein